LETIEGKIFGLWKVLSFDHKNDRYERYWLCECQCGVRAIRRDFSLIYGKTTGCRRCRNGMSKKPYEHLYNRIVNGSIKRGIECSIIYEDFIEFTKQTVCHYCDLEVNWTPHIWIGKVL
jgi:hypothetical protein